VIKDSREHLKQEHIEE